MCTHNAFLSRLNGVDQVSALNNPDALPAVAATWKRPLFPSHLFGGLMIQRQCRALAISFFNLHLSSGSRGMIKPKLGNKKVKIYLSLLFSFYLGCFSCILAIPAQSLSFLMDANHQKGVGSTFFTRREEAGSRIGQEDSCGCSSTPSHL